jgi:hypothetical protein
MPAKTNIGVLLLLVAAFPALGPLTSARADSNRADDEKVFDTVTVSWENDIFLGTDGDYTNGVRFSWSTPYRLESAAARLPEWSRPGFRLLPGGRPGGGRAVALAVGQAIYTPAAIDGAELDHNDRPYAGYSYLSASFHYRGPNIKTSWELQAGVVGPLSLAEPTQKFFHDASAINRAQGWDNQLDNEPTLEIIGARQWLLLHGEADHGFSFDLVPHLGGQFGNVAILANLGGELRWGWRLPKSFGTYTIRGGCESNSACKAEKTPPGMTPRSWYLFAGGDGRLVIRDIFLDGNTFTDSHSVKRIPLLGELMAGISLHYRVTKLTCAAVYRTKEFETQDHHERFGAFSLAWTY